MPLLDKVPEWARVFEASDPISLQPNRAEASEAKKDSGFLFQELITRQDLNYLQNLNGEWIKAFRNSNATFIQGFEHTGVFDEGGSTWSISFKKGIAMSSDKEMFFDAGVDSGWAGATLKKFITGGNFLPGDGQPGLAAGLTLGTTIWYHVFVIRLASGAIDVGFDTSIVAANLVAEPLPERKATHWRRISSFYWSDVIEGAFPGMDFIQNGDYFFSKTKVQGSVSVLDIGVGEQTKAHNIIEIPIDFRSKCMWKTNVVIGTDTAVSFIQIVGDEQLAAPIPTFNISKDIIIGGFEEDSIWTFHDGITQELTSETDASPNGNLQVATLLLMYIDERGRNDF